MGDLPPAWCWRQSSRAGSPSLLHPQPPPRPCPRADLGVGGSVESPLHNGDIAEAPPRRPPPGRPPVTVPQRPTRPGRGAAPAGPASRPAKVISSLSYDTLLEALPGDAGLRTFPKNPDGSPAHLRGSLRIHDHLPFLGKEESQNVGADQRVRPQSQTIPSARDGTLVVPYMLDLLVFGGISPEGFWFDKPAFFWYKSRSLQQGKLVASGQLRVAFGTIRHCEE